MTDQEFKFIFLLICSLIIQCLILLSFCCNSCLFWNSQRQGQDQTLNRDAVNFLSELIAWADREILPMIHRVTDPGEDESDGPAAKRTTSSLSEKTLLDLGKKVLQVGCKLCLINCMLLLLLLLFLLLLLLLLFSLT